MELGIEIEYTCPMKITSIGGGPAGLYGAILLKKLYPGAEIEVFERNRPDDTFGWGVVFSDETLGGFEEADPESYKAITESFIHWSEMRTWIRGTWTVSKGHGFSGLSRKQLLLILQDRCKELGVRLRFETEIESVEEVMDADLILGADGINSLVRETYKETFKPSLDWRKCKFAWFGTDLQLENFTFVFKETEHGLFQVHAYPFQKGLSTWIVECREEVWKKAGLDKAGEEESAAYCQDLFADFLGSARLLTNRSIWRTFPTVRNECWHKDKIVLLGDAAHTAHFSIGSGTKLAMEDAMALRDAFAEHGWEDVPATLAAYQESRYIDGLKLQKTAQTSLEWFENSARYLEQDPIEFTFNLMTRSKRITYDNLRLRDPELVDQRREDFARAQGAKPEPDGSWPVPAFVPFRFEGRELSLSNRIVVSPMCQYSAQEGVPTDWHLVHLGGLALGGAGLVFTEMCNVEAIGRITKGCAGMWSDRHRDAWKRIVDFVHENSAAKIGMQIAHAGRKGSTAHAWTGEDRPLRPEEGAWETIGPSALPFKPDWPSPRAMEEEDFARVKAAFVDAARRADEAGFDLVELHMAHGYLLSSFLSPLTNKREDQYGGSLENRMRFPLEVFRAVREVFSESKPVIARISASDWMGEEGFTPDEAVQVAKALGAEGLDLMDVSSAGNVPDSPIVFGRMYQVPFAEQIRYEAGIPVMAVGAILGSDHVNTILGAGRADLCALARPHLGNPHLSLHAAHRYGHERQFWPGPWLAGRDRPDLT